MDPHAVSAAPTPRTPVSRARRGLPGAAIIGMGLVGALLLAWLVLNLSTGALVPIDILQFDSPTGDTHTLYSHKSFSRMPANDVALEAWLRAQPGVQVVELRRRYGLELQLEYVQSERPVPQWLHSPPWEELGYQPAPGVSHSLFGGSRFSVSFDYP